MVSQQLGRVVQNTNDPSGLSNTQTRLWQPIKNYQPFRRSLRILASDEPGSLLVLGSDRAVTIMTPFLVPAIRRRILLRASRQHAANG
jgi:hypothetical protein